MTTDTDLQQFLNGLIPTDWFLTPPAVQYDDDEILVIGSMTTERSIDEFRDTTRLDRMAIADQVEAHFGRKVSWASQSVMSRHSSRLTAHRSPPDSASRSARFLTRW